MKVTFRKIWNFLIRIFHNKNNGKHSDRKENDTNDCEYDCKVLGYEDFEIEVEPDEQ